MLTFHGDKFSIELKWLGINRMSSYFQLMEWLMNLPFHLQPLWENCAGTLTPQKPFPTLCLTQQTTSPFRSALPNMWQLIKKWTTLSHPPKKLTKTQIPHQAAEGCYSLMQKWKLSAQPTAPGSRAPEAICSQWARVALNTGPASCCATM